MKNMCAFFIPLIAFGMASCGGNNPTDSHVDTANMTNYEAGIPEVELTRKFSSSEADEILGRAHLGTFDASKAISEGYRYRLGDNNTEFVTTNGATANFYGSDGQYAVVEISKSQSTKRSDAFSIKESYSQKVEYATGNAGKVTYIKTTDIDSAGKEETKFSYDRILDSKYKLPSSVYSFFLDWGELFFNSSYVSVRSGTMGCDESGKLYSVFYAESSSRVTAYDENGNTISGMTQSYMQFLVDLNTFENPRYNAFSIVNCTETNVDSKGIKQDSFHVTYKMAVSSRFEYGTLSDNEEKRRAIINEFPSSKVSLDQVYYLVNYRYSPNEHIINTNAVSGTNGAFYGVVTMNAGYRYTPLFAATIFDVDKTNDTVIDLSIGSGGFELSDSLIKDIGHSDDSEVRFSVIASSAMGSSETYDDRKIYVDGDSLIANQTVAAKIYFQLSSTEPYLSITSIELYY